MKAGFFWQEQSDLANRSEVALPLGRVPDDVHQGLKLGQQPRPVPAVSAVVGPWGSPSVWSPWLSLWQGLSLPDGSHVSTREVLEAAGAPRRWATPTRFQVKPPSKS